MLPWDVKRIVGFGAYVFAKGKNFLLPSVSKTTCKKIWGVYMKEQNVQYNQFNSFITKKIADFHNFSNSNKCLQSFCLFLFILTI